MEFFAVPYTVKFDDTTAYGDDHFLGNFKLQSVIREHLLTHARHATKAGDRTQPEKKIPLMQQGYYSNISPVKPGDSVVILFSSEGSTASTITFCFRVIRRHGVPVMCGFQAVTCVSVETGAMVPMLPEILERGTRMKEQAASQSFRERILGGQTKELFDDAITALAATVADSQSSMSSPRFLSTGNSTAVLQSSVTFNANFPNGIVFMCPGQGSYSQRVLRDLYLGDGPSAAFLRNADTIVERCLGQSILKLITAETPEQHDALLNKSPDIAQVGIYLGSILSARHLMRMGLKPDCVVGHSAGELAALAIAGVYSDEAGVEIMCKRILSLQAMNIARSGMLAVFSDEKRVSSVIEETGCASLKIAVVNDEEQIVVSGFSADLESIKSKLKNLGIRCTKLRSSYPFHSPLLEAAAGHFLKFLSEVRFGSPLIPVYSPIERGFYKAQPDMARLLASHLVRPFTFSDALNRLAASGASTFIECGAGDVLGEIVRRVLKNNGNTTVLCPLKSPDGAVESLNSLAAGLRERSVALEVDRPASIPDLTKGDGDGDDARERLAVNTPVAIVSMGCVLPGAENPRQFWENTLSGKNGISNAGEFNADMLSDFYSAGDVVPDKTYSLLGGFVRDFNPDVKSLPYDEEEFSRLSSAQRFLTAAMGQCMKGLATSLPNPARMNIYLGSTGDGVREYDEALFFQGMHHEVEAISAERKHRDAFHRVLDAAHAGNGKASFDLAPHQSFSAVAEKFIGSGGKVICADAACASSLYAIDLGLNALRRNECDVAFCGGVFAPGPANTCLFSQFRGLSATGSRPLDASADGVVFGEGAALLVLKRLSDAIRAGDKIHAVIRGSGLSNDGKSPSVAVPRRHGQVIAVKKAYQETGIPTSSIQYMEAHATATPVGDTEEFWALKDVFRDANQRKAPIELGSIKALIGHTGWLAGAASIIKMIEALNAKQIPPQSNFTSPNPNFGMDESPFRISTESRPWQENVGQEPRRAGVNGFGFGGSNAHVILEEYVPSYHGRWNNGSTSPKRTPSGMSVVGIGALFPADIEKPAARNRAPRFNRAALKLPKGFMLLPDVLDHMDKGQLLAFLAAFDALKNIGNEWKPWKASIGVVLGVEGKTGLGMAANKRIYRAFLERRLNALLAASSEASEAEIIRIKQELFNSIHAIQPSGPYTLPGIMPNVTSGRVSNLLDLNGPNFVIDAGGASLFEVISTADMLLNADKAQMILAGGVSGYAGPEVQKTNGARGHRSRENKPIAEGAIIFALTRPDFARAHKLPVIADLVVPTDHADARESVVGKKSACYLMGAEGALEIKRAIENVARGQNPVDVVWPLTPDQRNRTLRVEAPAPQVQERKALTPDRGLTKAQRGIAEYSSDAEKPVADHPAESQKFMAEHPIYFCTYRLTALEAGQPSRPFHIRPGRVMILTDQTSWRERPEAQKLLNELQPTILCPAARKAANALPIDLSTEESIAQSLSAVDFGKYDCVIAVKDISETPPFEGVMADGGSGEGLLDLMFAVVRKAYDGMKAGSVAFGSLCLNSPQDDNLHPYCGLLAGFVKAIARELPQCACKAVATDASTITTALDQFRNELAIGPLPGGAEILYKNSHRFEYTLQRHAAISSGNEHLLSSDSVVVATGGGRGVTAVLVEDLLRTYGCKVVLFGRTDPSSVPADILSMSKEEFDAHEAVFYQHERKRSPGADIKELKKRYEYFRNGREVRQTVAAFEKLSGTVTYMPVDITDQDAVDAAMKSIAEKFGSPDLIIHGAGLQVSKNTARKRIMEFRNIVTTKLGGLGNLYQAYTRSFAGKRCHFHLVTSVFSYFGNDGQPDYGAANEAMNHIANWMNGSRTGTEWTSLAWLGWAGIGMTKGSEYVVLGRLRGHRFVVKEEGQVIFSSLLRGKPFAPANLLITDSEANGFNVKFSSPGIQDNAYTPKKPSGLPAAGRDESELSWEFNPRTHPYILDHLVRGRPTYPGAFEFELATQAALALRPDLHRFFFENTKLTRFIKIPPDSSSITLRGRAQAVGESKGNTLIKVQILSDFVHRNGAILQKDVLHCETTLHLSRSPQIIKSTELIPDKTQLVASDPYLSPDSFVYLKGFFDCLGDIEIGARSRKGTCKIKETELLPLISHFSTPSILIDAMLRFSMIRVTPEGFLPICVPVSFGEIYLAEGVNDVSLATQGHEIFLSGTNPWMDGDKSLNDWVQAVDHEGRVLLLIKNSYGLKVGEVSPRKVSE